jgi:hypothetical protein
MLTPSMTCREAIMFYSSLLCRLRVDLLISVTSILHRNGSLTGLDSTPQQQIKSIYLLKESKFSGSHAY